MSVIKRKMTVLLAALAVLLMLSTATFAEGDAKVNVDSEGITVSGMLGGSDMQYIVAVFASDNETELNDDNISSVLVALAQGRAENDGTFEAVIPLGYSISSGSYIAEISTSGNFESVIRLEFYFLSQADIAAMADEFNDASTASELKALTEKYASELNIRFDGMYEDALSEDDVYKRMLTLKNKADFADAAGIKNAFDEACVMSALEAAESKDAYAELLKDNSFLLGTDVSELSADEIAEASKILMKKDFDIASELAQVFDESVCAAKFNLASRDEAEALIEEYKDFLDLPSEYGKSGSSAKEKRLALYKKIENKTDFESYDDISDFINDFYDDYDDSKGGSSGGGSGGGSGKTTASVQITPPATVVTEPVASGTSQLTPATNFEDLAGFEWALEAIEALANDKVILGVSETVYEPARSITREEFVKMIVVAFDIPSDSSLSFGDVPANAWYRTYVSSACKAGIVEGMGDGTFGTGRGITRQEMAAIMSRIIAYKNITVTFDDAKEFADSENIASWAKDAVDVLTANKILNGVSETHFAPEDSVNRAMAAKAVYGLKEFTNKQGEADK